MQIVAKMAPVWWKKPMVQVIEQSEMAIAQFLIVMKKILAQKALSAPC